MLTGDNRRTAEAVGCQLGMELRAEMLPEDKQKVVQELKAKGFVVAKVGDIAGMIDISERTLSNIYQNITLAVAACQHKRLCSQTSAFSARII